MQHDCPRVAACRLAQRTSQQRKFRSAAEQRCEAARQARAEAGAARRHAAQFVDVDRLCNTLNRDAAQGLGVHQPFGEAQSVAREADRAGLSDLLHT